MVRSVFRAAAAGLVALLAMPVLAATVITTETTSGNTLPLTPAVSTDLFQTSLLSVSPSGGDNLLTGPAKYNGTTGTASENGGANPANVCNGGTYDFSLNLAPAPAGYRVQQVNVYTGWGDFRAGQDFRAFYSVVGDSSFVQFADVNVSHSNGTLRVSISDNTGPIAGGVDQLRFIVDQSTHVYREIDVIGTPGGQLVQPGGAGAIGDRTIGDSLQNVARTGTATQSSNYSASFPASNAINGNYGDFSHTAASQLEQWWQVDLGATYTLDEIKIFNRYGNGSRLTSPGGGFRTSVLDALGNEVWGVDDNVYTANPEVRDVSGVSGRTIRLSKLSPITSGDDGTINLAEVEVWAAMPGNFTLSQGSSLEIELAADLGLADKLAVSGALTIQPGATLDVLLLSGSPAGGQRFDILDFGSIAGTFDTINLPGGLAAWNITDLYTTGEIAFAADIPEPVTLALLGLAAGHLGGYLRRRRA